MSAVILVWIVTSTALNGGMFFGANAAAVTNDIPVQPSVVYRAVVWVRGISNYAGVDMTFRLRDQVSGNLGSDVIFQLSAGWQRLVFAATTLSGRTHVRHVLFKTSDTVTKVTFETTGFMLVAGSVAPTAFNSGSPSDLYDNLTDRVTFADWFLGIHKPYQDCIGSEVVGHKTGQSEEILHSL